MAFDLASGIEVGHGGVFVGAPPYLWFIENKNDKPGKFEILLKGFGSQDTHETLNTFQWGPDGWLYGLHGVFTHSEVKPAQARRPGRPHERRRLALPPEDRRSSRSSPRGRQQPVGHGLAQHRRPVHPRAAASSRTCSTSSPAASTSGRRARASTPTSTATSTKSATTPSTRKAAGPTPGLISLDVPHMPEKFRNSVIFGSIHGCSIKQNILKPNGSTFTAQPRRRLPGQRRQELPPDQPAVGPERRHLPHRLARPEPVPPDERRTTGTTSAAGCTGFS